MREAAFDGTWEGWRDAARTLLAAGVSPSSVVWRPLTDPQPALGGLFEQGAAAEAAPTEGGSRVPRAFLDLAELAAAHRDRTRWDLLYRVLWRLTHGEPYLLDVVVDRDVRRLLDMEKSVRREIHKVHAFVRFRRVVVSERGEPNAGVEHYIAWIEPVHPVLALAAPLFVRRFAGMRWGILTPERSVFWDGARLLSGPGVPRRGAPSEDPIEELWRTYYAHVFNPARVNPRAMRREMPKRYWTALPESPLIAELVADAPRRVQEMIERGDGAEPD